MPLDDLARAFLVLLAPLITTGALETNAADPADTTLALARRTWEDLQTQLAGSDALTWYLRKPGSADFQEQLAAQLAKAVAGHTAQIAALTQAVAALTTQPSTTTQTISGSTVGVALGQHNYGTIMVTMGQPAPAAPTPPPNLPQPEAITAQIERLAAARQTLAIYLRQRAQLGSAWEPPVIASGINEARATIRAIKATLRGWGQDVRDGPDD